jgi:hypothetical protein
MHSMKYSRKITVFMLYMVLILRVSPPPKQLTENMRGRNRAESERSSIEQDNAFLLAMGDGALPSPYPEENPDLVRLPTIMCVSVTD